MKTNNKIKDAFSEIHVSESLERKIFDMTIEKKEKNKRWIKLIYASCIVLAVCFLSLTTVYADEIKKILDNWSSSIHLEDGTEVKITENNIFKEIPNTAKKVKAGENRLEMTHSEIEEMLGFKLLNYDLATTDVMYYNTGLNDDSSIGRVDIWWANFIYSSQEKSVSLSLSMLNKNADEGYILAFQEGLDATGEKVIEDSYISENLGVKVILYSNEWSNERLTATFAYDNVLYKLIGKNISKEEIMNIIENLHL